MAIYGYARASTLEQDVTIQEEALRRAGCEIIRSEKVSGGSRAGRSELALLGVIAESSRKSTLRI